MKHQIEIKYKCEKCEYNNDGVCDANNNNKPCPSYCSKCASSYHNKLVHLRKHHNSFDEVWSLDNAVARFIIPRLEAFKESLTSYPCDLSPEEWFLKIRYMILYFRMKRNDKEGLRLVNFLS